MIVVMRSLNSFSVPSEAGPMADIGEFVTRKGIYPPLPDANKIQLVDMVEMDKEAFTQKMAEYKKIFLQQ